MSLSSILDDLFAHATTTTGGAGTTSGVPTPTGTPGWTDVAGGMAHIDGSNHLIMATNAGAPGHGTNGFQELTRSDISGNADQQTVISIPSGQGTNAHVGIVLRRLDADNYYLAEFNNFSHNVKVYSYVAGVLSSALITISTIGATGSAYTLDFSATGANPTTLSVTVTETPNAPQTASANDATAALQATGLGFGLSQWTAGQTITISHVQEYNTALALSLSGGFTVGFGGREPFSLGMQNFVANPNLTDEVAFVNGSVSAVNGIDDHYEDPGVVLAAGASKTYTLSALIDLAHRAIAFSDIRVFAIAISNRSPGDYLTLSPGATHGWAALIPATGIKVYRSFGVAVDSTDSYPVVAGVTDTFKVLNSGSNPMTFSLLFAGNSG